MTNARTGEGEKTLSDKRKVADALRLAAEDERIRIDIEKKDEKTLFNLWVKPIIGAKKLQDISDFDVKRIKKRFLFRMRLRFFGISRGGANGHWYISSGDKNL